MTSTAVCQSYDIQAPFQRGGACVWLEREASEEARGRRSDDSMHVLSGLAYPRRGPVQSSSPVLALHIVVFLLHRAAACGACGLQPTARAFLLASPPRPAPPRRGPAEGGGALRGAPGGLRLHRGGLDEAAGRAESSRELSRAGPSPVCMRHGAAGASRDVRCET
ncbi:Eukaryotic translation initiation factor 3 subunit A [Frankliniella fusca]|uniref:Eukaryotic translation initiation factor 3 subunit A n=1 Tax=Frankliniella fusca TaxID=407009 RepID=A0AAE1LE26_9NEOP|nr:Eukaryotic translation initiation factor 3 subunit A [Frankliniella fusca]